MTSASSLLASIRRQTDWRLVCGIVVLILLYCVTRLTHILSLPIFSDEGIYIGWARIAAYDPAWRFISLIDGKQPLQTWGTIPLIKLLPQDQLLAGRLFSVCTGLFGFAGLMTLSGYLWGKRAALLGGLLYVISPYFLFYDRMALVDSGVNASVIWILFFSILLARTLRLDVAMIFGFGAGLGLLAKSSVALFVGLSVFAVLFTLQDTSHSIDKVQSHLFRKKYLRRVVDFGALFAVAGMIAGGMYLTQKFFSPFFHYIAQKNLTFILSPSEWLSDPFSLVATNMRLLPLYVLWEAGWVPVVLGVVGLALLWRTHRTLAVYLTLWIIVPALLIINFNKVLFPRYLIFFASLFTLGTVYLLIHLRKRTQYTVLLIISTVIMSALCYPIIFDVRAISLPPVDRGQYIEGSTAVWGTQDLMERVRQATRDGRRALVLAEGNFGLIADVLSVYVRPDDRIEIRGAWPLNEEDILLTQTEMPDKHVFVVFSHRTDFPVHWEEIMERVAVYDKPNNSPDKVYLYRMLEKSPQISP